jgi:hypothetical protein
MANPRQAESSSTTLYFKPTGERIAEKLCNAATIEQLAQTVPVPPSAVA